MGVATASTMNINKQLIILLSKQSFSIS